MFEFIRGNVAKISEEYVALDVNGIGFKIYTSMSSASSCTMGELATFYTYLSVTENDMRLFGFVSEEELNMFELLMTVSGVGPKAGIAVLSGISVRDLTLAISKDDYKPITKVKGIGAKIAQKIVLELKDKVSVFESGDTSEDSFAKTTAASGNTVIDEAIDALLALGINPQKARTKVTEAYKEGMELETLVKLALKG